MNLRMEVQKCRNEYQNDAEHQTGIVWKLASGLYDHTWRPQDFESLENVASVVETNPVALEKINRACNRLGKKLRTAYHCLESTVPRLTHMADCMVVNGNNVSTTEPLFHIMVNKGTQQGIPYVCCPNCTRCENKDQDIKRRLAPLRHCSAMVSHGNDLTTSGRTFLLNCDGCEQDGVSRSNA